MFCATLLVQVFPSETQNALPSFGRERFLRFRSRKRIGAKREGALIRLLRCLGCHSPFGRNGILDILNIAPEGGKNKSIKRRRNRPTKIKIGCQTAPAPLRGLLLEAGFNCCAPFGCCCATLLFVRINCRPEGTIRACFMVRINCLLSCAATNGDLTNNRVAQQHHPRRSMLLFRRNKRGVETPYPKAPRVWISPDLNF